MYTVYRLTLQYFRTHGPISSSALRAPRHFLVDLAVPVAVRLSIISWSSSSVMRSPSSLATRFRFLKLIFPVS